MGGGSVRTRNPAGRQLLGASPLRARPGGLPCLSAHPPPGGKYGDIHILLFVADLKHQVKKSTAGWKPAEKGVPTQQICPGEGQGQWVLL